MSVTSDSDYKQLAGLHTYSVEHQGYVFTGAYEYEPEQLEDETDPYISAQYAILKVFINGSKHDAYELLNPDLIAHLERKLAA